MKRMKKKNVNRIFFFFFIDETFSKEEKYQYCPEVQEVINTYLRETVCVFFSLIIFFLLLH